MFQPLRACGNLRRIGLNCSCRRKNLLFGVAALFWIFLWFCLSAFVLGAFVWTTRLLMAQKNTWLAYARKHNLAFDKGTFFGAPSMSGQMGGYRLTAFSEEQPAPDARGRRFRTVIELMRPSGLPVRGAAGSGDMVPLIRGVDMQSDVIPDSPEWKSQWLARSDDKSLMKAYLTPERIKALAKLFSAQKLSSIFIFDHEDALLRCDTGDPLHDPARLEKLVKMMVAVSDAMIPRPGEIPEAPVQTPAPVLAAAAQTPPPDSPQAETEPMKNP